LCGALPPGAASPADGPGQRIALRLVLQFGEPGLAQGLGGGVVDHHRGLLGGVVWLCVEDAAKAGRSGSGDRPVFEAARP
jgi:hypothetical protein